ncbi:DUF2867 domain-containing protein [Mycobacterium palustre]|uniref:DUF2867 domain-containing protein n=1 Tax=Mycobacterium palustre TaxID=153971 RepID=A0A1X1ZT93_9MYCO|nr:DUF2867 domain-containing protein [Mycobacterium palustre]MCV7098963.1 DUF2867 domain-containing protein [Mycobacterium palustre]ORW26555.1 hypothetical protein AWC19_03545 [Mycobacterium palustre]
MERLPYIDEHAITVTSNREDTWTALVRVMCRDPRDPSTVPAGFVLDEARRPERFGLKGRHPFAAYRLVFELDGDSAHRTRLRAQTWAAFPGPHGKVYRALVIGTGAHRIVVRRMLKRVAATALAARGQTGETDADYTDVFEVPIPQGDSRTAEQAFRDGLGGPRARGSLVLWIHRHLLRFRLAPHSTRDHMFGWSVVRSDREELVLAACGPLMRGQLALRFENGRAALTTRLHYVHPIVARAVWAVVGPLHRAVAPRMVERSARRGPARMAHR